MVDVVVYRWCGCQYSCASLLDFCIFQPSCGYFVFWLCCQVSVTAANGLSSSPVQSTPVLLCDEPPVIASASFDWSYGNETRTSIDSDGLAVSGPLTLSIDLERQGLAPVKTVQAWVRAQPSK